MVFVSNRAKPNGVRKSPTFRHELSAARRRTKKQPVEFFHGLFKNYAYFRIFIAPVGQA